MTDVVAHDPQSPVAAASEDRFPRLVPPARLLDLGIRMMEEASATPFATPHAQIHYRTA